MQLADKTARNDYARAYYQKHRAAKLAYQRQYKKDHAAAISEQRKNYYSLNKERLLAGTAAWVVNNKEKKKEIARRYYEANKTEFLNYNCARYAENKEEILTKQKAYYEKNIDERRSASREHYNTVKNTDAYKSTRRKIGERRRHDPKQRVRNQLGSGMRKALLKQGASKTGYGWEAILGYTAQQLREHLEQQFTEGMAWANYGRKGWNIDHIVPVCAFSHSGIDDPDFRKCWALSNLRPLWEKDNIAKAKDDRKLSLRARRKTLNIADPLPPLGDSLPSSQSDS